MDKYLKTAVSRDYLAPNALNRSAGSEPVYVLAIAAGSDFLQQQAKFDAFVHEFNNQRPPMKLWI